MANGALRLPNEITIMRKTMATATAIATPNWIKLSLIGRSPRLIPRENSVRQLNGNPSAEEIFLVAPCLSHNS